MDFLEHITYQVLGSARQFQLHTILLFAQPRGNTPPEKLIIENMFDRYQGPAESHSPLIVCKAVVRRRSHFEVPREHTGNVILGSTLRVPKLQVFRTAILFIGR